MRLVSLSVLFLLAACTTPRHSAPVLTPAELKKEPDYPMSHLVYYGSDSHFHYVKRSRLKSSAWRRIPRSILNLEREFPVGTDEPYVLFRRLIAAGMGE